MAIDNFHAVGRRKTAVARVYLRPGHGGWKINGRELDDYFPRDTYRQVCEKPFQEANITGKFDVKVNVRGGGLTGQAGAISLGISKALLRYDEDLRSVLRKSNLLTRDPRMVERKKYGQKKARKRFQFSKR